MSNKKKFTIPKRAASKELLEFCGKSSREYIKVKSDIEHSFWNTKCGIQINKIEIVNNEELSTEFKKKKLEMQKENKRDLWKSNELTYGFRSADGHSQAKQLCKSGLATDCIDPSIATCLGDPKHGIYLSRCADVLSKAPPRVNKPLVMVVFQILKGRLKSIAEQHGSDNDLMEPTPSFDGHISNNFRNIEPGSIKNLCSYGRIFDSCQIFLYEIDLDSDDLYSKRPRQCLPYAVVYYTFTYTPPIDSPIFDTHSKVAPPKSNESQASVSIADPQDPFAADTSFAGELEKAQEVWTGKLFHKLTSLTDVRVISHARDTLIHVPLLSDHISMRMKMKMSKLKESLPKVLFNTTPFDSKDPKVVMKNGREYLHCEMYPLNKRSTTYARLKRSLKLRSEVVMLKLHQGSDLFILPTCELTKQLGITFDDYPEVLHLIFICKTGENYALASGSENFKTDARTILDSRVLEIEKLKLATPTVAPPPLLDIDNDSESPFYDEEDWEDYPLFFTDVEKEAVSVRIQRARKAATEEMIMSGHRYKTVYKTPYFITRPGGAQVAVSINHQVDDNLPYQVQQHSTSVSHVNANAKDPRLLQRSLSFSLSDIRMSRQGSHTEMASLLDDVRQGSMGNSLIGGSRDPRFQNTLQEQILSSFTPNVQQESCQARTPGQALAPAASRAKDRPSSLSTLNDEHSSDQLSAQSLARLVLQNLGPHHTHDKASLAVAENSVCSAPPGSITFVTSANSKNSVMSLAPGSVPSVDTAYAQPRKEITLPAASLREHPRNVKSCDPQTTVSTGANFNRDSDIRFVETSGDFVRKPQDPRLKPKTLEDPIVPGCLSSHTVELKKLMTKFGVNFVSNPATESIVKNCNPNLTSVDSCEEFSPSTTSLTIGNYLNRICVSSEIKEAIKSDEIENELYAKAEECLHIFHKPQDTRHNVLLLASSDSSASSNTNSEANVSSAVVAAQNINKRTVSQINDVDLSPKSDTAHLVSSSAVVGPTNTSAECNPGGLSGYASTVATSNSQRLDTSAVNDPRVSLSSEPSTSTLKFKRKDQETNYFGLPSGTELEGCPSSKVFKNDGKLERAAGSRFSTNHFWKQSASPFRLDQSKTTNSTTASNELIKHIPCSRASDSVKQKEDKSSTDNNSSETDSHMPKDKKILLETAAVSIIPAKSDLALTLPVADTAMPSRSTYSSRSDNCNTIPSIAKISIPPLMSIQQRPVSSYKQPAERAESGLGLYRTSEQQKIAEQQRILEQQRIVNQQRIAQQQAIAFAQQLAMSQPQAMAIQHVLAQQQIVQQQAMAFRASQAAKSQACQAYKPLTPPPQPPAMIQSLFSMLNKTAIDPRLMPPADPSNLIFLDQTASGRRHSLSRHQDNVNKLLTFKRNGNKEQRKRDQTHELGTISKSSPPVSIDKQKGETCNESKKIRGSKSKADVTDNSFCRKTIKSLKSSCLPDKSIDDTDEDICDSPVSLIADDDWSEYSVDLEKDDLDQNINTKDQNEGSSDKNVENKLSGQPEDERSMDELLARYTELKKQLSKECDVEMSDDPCSDVNISSKLGTYQDTKTSPICAWHDEDIGTDVQIDRSGTNSKAESGTVLHNVAHTDHVSLANIKGPASRRTQKNKELYDDAGQEIAERAALQLSKKIEKLDVNIDQKAAVEHESAYEYVTPVSKEEAASQSFDKNLEQDDNDPFEDVSPVSKEEASSLPLEKNLAQGDNVSFEGASLVGKEEAAQQPLEKNLVQGDNVSFEGVSPVSKEKASSLPLEKNLAQTDNVSLEDVSPVSKEEASSQPFEKNLARGDNVPLEDVSPVSKEEAASQSHVNNQELDINADQEAAAKHGLPCGSLSPVSKNGAASQSNENSQELIDNVDQEVADFLENNESAGDISPKQADTPISVFFESEDDDIGLACKEFVKSVMNDGKEKENLTDDSSEIEGSAVIGVVDSDMAKETHSRPKPTKRRIFYGGLDIRHPEDIPGEIVISPLDGKKELCISIAANKQTDDIDCDYEPKVSVSKAENRADVEHSQEEDLRAKLNKLRMDKRRGKRLQSVINEPPEQVDDERLDYNPVAEKTEDVNENYMEGEKSRKEELHVTNRALTAPNDCKIDDKKPGEDRKLRSSARKDVVCSEKSEKGTPKRSPGKGHEGKMKEVVTRSLRSSAKSARDSSEKRGRYRKQNRNRSLSSSSSRSPSGHRRGRSRISEGSKDRAYRRISRPRVRRSRSRRRSSSSERSYSRGRCSASRGRPSPSRKTRSRSRGRRSYSTDRHSRRKGSRSPDSFGRDVSRRTRAGLKQDQKSINPPVKAKLHNEESFVLSKETVESTKEAKGEDGSKTVCELEALCKKGLQGEPDVVKRMGRESGEKDKIGASRNNPGIDNQTKQEAKEIGGHSETQRMVAIPTIASMTITDNSDRNSPQSDGKPEESSSTLNWYDEAEVIKYNVSTNRRDCGANGNSKQLIHDKALAVSGLIPVAVEATKVTLLEFANASSQSSANVIDPSRPNSGSLQQTLPCQDFDDKMFDEVYSIDKTLSNVNLKDTVLTAVNKGVQSLDPPPAKKSKLYADTPFTNTKAAGSEIMKEVLESVAALDNDLVLLEAKEQGKVDLIAVCDMDLSEEDSQQGSTEESSTRRESFDSEQGSQDNEKPDRMSYPDLKADPIYKTSSIMQDLMSWSQNTAKVLSKTLASPREKELQRLPSQRNMMAANVNINPSKVQNQTLTATITTAVASHVRGNIEKPSEAMKAMENVRKESNSRISIPEKQYFIPTIANVAKPLEEARFKEKPPSTASVSLNLVAVKKESKSLEVGDTVGRKETTRTVGRVRPLVQEAIESGSQSLSFKKDNGIESQGSTKEGRHSEKCNKDFTKAVIEIQEHDFPSRAPNSSGKPDGTKGGKETRTQQVNLVLKEPPRKKLSSGESTEIFVSQKPTKIVRPHISHDEMNIPRDPVSIHSHVRAKQAHQIFPQMLSHETKLPRNNGENESNKLQLSKEHHGRAKEGVGSHLEVDECGLETEIKRLRYQDIRYPSISEDYKKLVNEKYRPKERSPSHGPPHSERVRSLKAVAHEERLYGRTSLLENSSSPHYSGSSATVEISRVDGESYDSSGTHRYDSSHKRTRNNRRNHSTWEEGSRFNDREPHYGEKAPSLGKQGNRDAARKEFRDELNRRFNFGPYQSKFHESHKEYYDGIEQSQHKMTEADLISVSPNRRPNFRHEDSDGANDERSRKYTKGGSQLSDQEELLHVYSYDERKGVRNEAQPRHDDRMRMYGEKKSHFEERELRYGKAEARLEERFPGFRMEDSRFQQRDHLYEERSHQSDYIEAEFDDMDSQYEEREHQCEYRDSRYEEDRLEYVDIKSPLESRSEDRKRRSKFDLRYSKNCERDPKMVEQRTVSSYDFREDRRSARFEEGDHHYDQGKYMPLELEDNREDLATVGTDSKPSYYKRYFEHYAKRPGNEYESEYYERTARRGCTSYQINDDSADAENSLAYSERLSTHAKDPRVPHNITSTAVPDREPVPVHRKAFYDNYESESQERSQGESSRFRELDHDLRHNRPSQEKDCVYRDDRENRMNVRDGALSSDRDDLRCYLKNLRHMRDDLRNHLDDDENDEVVLSEKRRPQELMRQLINSDKQRQFSLSPNVLERMAKRDRDIDMEFKGSFAERRRLENIGLRHDRRSNYPRRLSPQDISGSDFSGEELSVEGASALGSRVGKQPSLINQTGLSSKKNMPVNHLERSDLPTLMPERCAGRFSSFADQEFDFMSDAPPKGLKSHREGLGGSYDQEGDIFRYVEASKPIDFVYPGRKVTGYQRGYDSYAEDVDNDGRPFFGGILRDEERSKRPSARQPVRKKPKKETRSNLGQEEWP